MPYQDEAPDEGVDYRPPARTPIRSTGISANAVIVAIVAIVLFATAAVVYIVIVGREPDQVVALISLIGAPTILSLFNLLRSDRTAQQADQNGKDLASIRKQTNGAFTRMSDRMDLIEETMGMAPVQPRRPAPAPAPVSTRWDIRSDRTAEPEDMPPWHPPRGREPRNRPIPEPPSGAHRRYHD